MTLSWGLLGPGSLRRERRTRTLGLSASVRLFNELAVPGIGGVWFGKQVLLATLGVKVASAASRRDRMLTNIEVANAIEALACYMDFRATGWQTDPRLRGVNKLRTQESLEFRLARQPRFYVTQPMRMTTVEALPALGLAHAGGVRFNTFQCTEAGELLIEAACTDWRPHRRTVVEHLVRWATSLNDERVDTESLHMALSPRTSLPQRAGALLMQRLVSGSGSEMDGARQRRRDALAWVEHVRTTGTVNPAWERRPAQISALHWADLRAGARFAAARNAAYAVLDALEVSMAVSMAGSRRALHEPIPDSVERAIQVLRQRAAQFLDERHIDSESSVFCRECCQESNVQVLKSLISRDDRILRLRGNDVVPGPAFDESGARARDGTQESQGVDVQPGNGLLNWPKDISFRIRNLFLLNADLHGNLDHWLTVARPEPDAHEVLAEEAA
ncbi:hypothetical protein [Achromobacter xylosoxidans]|uniref:hypothetical protein n=1 Tax=Alcaligenes xylosoxydans xylosoxydans TaxID=85698 RepID=UPI001F131A47|nr:hypothetical protein [Achromobacter xylosoxidans]